MNVKNIAYLLNFPFRSIFIQATNIQFFKYSYIKHENKKFEKSKVWYASWSWKDQKWSRKQCSTSALQSEIALIRCTWYSIDKEEIRQVMRQEVRNAISLPRRSFSRSAYFTLIGVSSCYKKIRKVIMTSN